MGAAPFAILGAASWRRGMNEPRNCRATRSRDRARSYGGFASYVRAKAEVRSPPVALVISLSLLHRLGAHRTQIEELAALTAKGAAGGPAVQIRAYKRSLRCLGARAKAREADELRAAQEKGLKRPPKPQTAAERQRAVDRKRMRSLR